MSMPERAPCTRPVLELRGATVRGFHLVPRQRLLARGPGASTPIRLKLVLRTSGEVRVRLRAGPSGALPAWGAGAPCHECRGLCAVNLRVASQPKRPSARSGRRAP